MSRTARREPHPRLQLPRFTRAQGQNLVVRVMNQMNFWHAFSVYRKAVADQEPNTLQSAQATLPAFQEALRLLGLAGEYPASVGVNLSEIQSNVGTYIEIQEAIIKRGS